MSGHHHVGAFEQRVHTLLEGVRREFTPSAEPVIFGGRSMTLAELIATLEEMEDTFEAVHFAQRTYQQTLANRRRAMKAHRSTYEDMVVFLKHLLGKASPRLAGFGIVPPKSRRALTAEAAAIARAKAAATRKARGTLGRRQRLALGRTREPSMRVLNVEVEPLNPAVPVAVDAPTTSEPEPSGLE